MTTLSAELHSVEDVSQTKETHHMHCYENFVKDTSTLGVVNMHNHWTCADFVKQSGKVYSCEQDFETSRVSALAFRFEYIENPHPTLP